MNLRIKLNGLRDKITQHPLLEIYERSESSGVDPVHFELFKKQYGIDLPSFIQEAYLDMNGFTFVYGLKDNSDEGLALFNASSQDYLIEKGPPYVVGSIKFLSFEKIFLENTWEGMLYNTHSLSDGKEFEFKKIKYTFNIFGKQLKPFDIFSEETCAAFLLLPDLRFDVILLVDHYVDWKNSRVIGFEDYCKLVFSTAGIIESRERYLSQIDGDLSKKIIIKDTKKLIPKIFRQ